MDSAFQLVALFILIIYTVAVRFVIGIVCQKRLGYGMAILLCVVCDETEQRV